MAIYISPIVANGKTVLEIKDLVLEYLEENDIDNTEQLMIGIACPRGYYIFHPRLNTIESIKALQSYIKQRTGDT